MATLEKASIEHIFNTPKFHKEKGGVLGHNTKAYWSGSVPQGLVTYHGNIIAALTLIDNTYEFSNPNHKSMMFTKLVMVTNCGWNTSTTRERMNHVLSSNGIPWYFHQNNFNSVLTERNGDSFPYTNRALFAWSELVEEWVRIEDYA